MVAAEIKNVGWFIATVGRLQVQQWIVRCTDGDASAQMGVSDLSNFGTQTH